MIIDLVKLGWMLNLLAVFVLIINGFVNIRHNRSEYFYWNERCQNDFPKAPVYKRFLILIPFFTAYRLFELYLWYGRKEGFMLPKMMYETMKDRE